MMPAPLRVHPSRMAVRCLAGLHLAALGVALLVPLWWCVAATLVLLAHFLWLRRAPMVPDSLQALPDGRLELRWQGGRSQQAEIIHSSLITPVFIVLNLRLEPGRMSLILWPDSAEKNALRQWRVWLRWDLPAIKRRSLAVEMDQE